MSVKARAAATAVSIDVNAFGARFWQPTVKKFWHAPIWKGNGFVPAAATYPSIAPLYTKTFAGAGSGTRAAALIWRATSRPIVSSDATTFKWFVTVAETTARISLRCENPRPNWM